MTKSTLHTTCPLLAAALFGSLHLACADNQAGPPGVDAGLDTDTNVHPDAGAGAGNDSETATGADSSAGAETGSGGEGGSVADGGAYPEGGATEGGLACRTTGTAFPKGAGVLNVKDFGALGDGAHDDTSAIESAIESTAHDYGTSVSLDNIVYFPAGTYLVSDTLQKKYPDGGYASGMLLIGESRCTVTLKLVDHAPSFADAAHPKAVIYTSSKLLDQGSLPHYPIGGGNDAYFNYVQHMTVDVGTGNPGATAINYMSNNIGSIRDVTVRSTSGEGTIGVDMTRPFPGPTLLEDVLVEGFDVGVAAANTEYGVTIDRLTLRGQHVTGLRNDRNMLSMHALTIQAPAHAIENVGQDGLITIQEGTITSTGTGQDAVTNAGALAIMKIKATGFASFLGQSQSADIDGTFQGATRNGDFGSHFSLVAPEEPDPPNDPLSTWVSVTDFGAKADLNAYANLQYPTSGSFDSSAGIQAAMNAGASTVYFPHGIYYFTKNITVPEGVHHIVGMSATLRAANGYDAATRTQGVLRFTNTTAPAFVTNLNIDNDNVGIQVGVEVAGAGTVVLRDVTMNLLLRQASGGTVFLSNTTGGMQISGPAPVFARQLDSEGGLADLATAFPPTGTPYFIINKGTPLWILGMKTERPVTALDNRAGSVTNIVGGLFYMVAAPSGPMTLFQNTDATFSASFVEEAFSTANRYTNYLVDTESGTASTTPASSFPLRTAPDVGRVATLLGR